MRYVSVVVPWWFRVGAVSGSIKTLLFRIYYYYHCQNNAKLSTRSAIKCRGYQPAVLMQRLSKRRIYSALINAQC